MKKLQVQEKKKLINHLKSFASPGKKTKINEIVELRTYFLTVIAEDIQKSHNASAIMRTCDCMGIQNIHIVQKAEEYFSKYQTRGADKWLSLHNYQSISPCMEKLSNEGYDIVAMSPKATKSIYDLKLSKPTAFVFGSEHNGLSKEALNLSDEVVSVPNYGFTESLNVSVTAAIVLSYFNESIRNSNTNWQLTKDEKLNLILEWLTKSIPNGTEIAENYLKQ